ncbi:MAG: competence/damage-inducible protein A [Planctomycetota bacterium]|jgi:nicotinamide-nucleotide amidase
MKACVVSIGNELLTGQTVDTNAAWLCEQLFAMGIETVGCWMVPDVQKRIVEALEQTCRAGQLVLVTGGLGPTEDDLTRQAVAAFLGVELEIHKDLLEWLKEFFESRGSVMAEANRSQAYIPAGCEVLDNPCGTAPGFVGKKGDTLIATMPGVPSEMKTMFAEQVLPRVQAIRTGSVIASGKVRCFGVGESRLADKLGDLMDRGRNPLINCTCGSGEILLHVIARADDTETAKQMVKGEQVMLADFLGDWVYGFDDDSLAGIVGGLLRSRGKTIALAESCTGGWVGQMLTDIPGASEYFSAGWITYSNDAKIEQLGVPRELIEQHGAVSEPVAQAMAQQAAAKSGADIAIGITGIAGPGGGTGEKPVGLVYISLCFKGDSQVHEFRFPATNRWFIRKRTAFAALNLARLQLGV